MREVKKLMKSYKLESPTSQPELDDPEVDYDDQRANALFRK